MRYYAYFPGCSAEATAAALGLSAVAVAKALDVDLIELEDWNCCGSSPYGGVDEIEATCVAARNLALAEKAGLDLVTPCSSCYITLNRANSHIKEHPKTKAIVKEALAAANLEYRGTVKVRHVVEVLLNDITPNAIASKVKKKLGGLKVAPYYGCQIVRPGYGFDDKEFPVSLDRLTESLGAEVVPFALKARCCGGSLIISEEDRALGLINKLLSNVSENGAQCIVTDCPLCQINLDAYQGKVNSKFRKEFNFPILFLTQLMGVSLGLEPKSLGLEKNIVSPSKVLASYL
jgi:heterodisulfide reductase subunit B